MAYYTWIELLLKVETLIPHVTEEKLGRALGVTRPTVNKWKNEKSTVPDWKSVTALAEFISQQVDLGNFKPESLEDISLVGWAKQTLERGFLVSMPAPLNAFQIFSTQNFGADSWLTIAISGATGAGLGATGFIISAAFGPIGLAVGSLAGFVTGYFLAEKKKKEFANTKLELDKHAEFLSLNYKNSLEELLTQILKIHEQHQVLIEETSVRINKSLSKNPDFQKNIGPEAEGNLMKQVKSLPSPIAYFDLDPALLERMYLELSGKRWRSHNK